MTTIGLELEFGQVAWSRARQIRPPHWTLERDGSCTHEGPTLQGQAVALPRGVEANYDRVGGEMVSPVAHDWSELEEDVQYICSGLDKAGAVLANTTSVHVHIGVGFPPLETLKAFLELAVALEDQMFRLAQGEMRQHRGLSNDYLYARPLTGMGPQIVKDSYGNWRWAFALGKLFKAETTQEFYQAFCRADVQPSKWIPARYYWINFVPILRQNTLEFRLFNQTLEPKFIKAWVDVCLAFVAAAQDKDQSWSPSPLGSKASLSKLIKAIGRYFEYADTYKTLGILWSKGVYCPPARPQINHLVLERGRTVALDELPVRLRPPKVPEEIIVEVENV